MNAFSLLKMAEPISLQKVKERFHLSQNQLDAEVSQEHLIAANRIIGDHRILGPQLGLSPEEMDDIKQERSPKLQRSAMLKKWKEKFAWEATYGVLIEALLKCSRADCAGNVCKLLTQSKYRHRAVDVDIQFLLSLVTAGASPEQPGASAGHSAALPTSPQSHHTATSTDGAQHGVFTSSHGIVCN